MRSECIDAELENSIGLHAWPSYHADGQQSNKENLSELERAAT